MTVNYISLGERIKTIRKNKKMSQSTLAERIEQSQTYISYIENGNKIMSLDTFVAIANELNISADDLLTDSLNVSSKAYDQGLILYDTDVKLGFTANAKMTTPYGTNTDSFNSTGDLTPGYLCGTGWSASEEVSFDLENCFVETTRVEGTVTFVKEEYVADYKLSEMDTNSYQNADITLVNGEHISRGIQFGCKY